MSEVRDVRTCRAKQGAPVAPERVDRAEDGWALVSVQPLTDWNGQRLILPLGLAPRFLWRPDEPTPAFARRLLAMEVLAAALARERRWYLLQARGTGWVRAVRVAAPLGGRVRWLTVDGASPQLRAKDLRPERRDLTI